jgi:hypothetical protein
MAMLLPKRVGQHPLVDAPPCPLILLPVEDESLLYLPAIDSLKKRLLVIIFPPELAWVF